MYTHDARGGSLPLVALREGGGPPRRGFGALEGEVGVRGVQVLLQALEQEEEAGGKRGGED